MFVTCRRLEILRKNIHKFILCRLICYFNNLYSDLFITVFPLHSLYVSLFIIKLVTGCVNQLFNFVTYVVVLISYIPIFCIILPKKNFCITSVI